MTPKKIAVLGGGNGAHTMAAEMTLKGHTVNLYEMPQFKSGMKKVFETQTIKLQGNIKELQGPVKLNMVTDDIAAAVEGCHYILLVCPAFAHADYAKLLKGHLHTDQIVVTFPGAFAALVLKNVLGDEDCPIFADANNLPYDSRLEMNFIPYLINGYESLESAFGQDSYFFENYTQILGDLDIKLLGMYVEGLIGLGFATMPENYNDVNADKKGLMVRAPAIEVYNLVTEDMGFSATTIPYADLYTAMQTGVCNGWIGGTPQLNYSDFRDVIKYYVP